MSNPSRENSRTSILLGCDRAVIAKGAELLGWELNQLFREVLEAMQSMPDPDVLDEQNGIG